VAAVVLRPVEQADLPKAKPFLKWAGGKRQLLPHLLEAVSRAGSFRTYYEPFLGGGALFFELQRTGILKGQAVLSDINEKLVETYIQVRNDVAGVTTLLAQHAKRHCYSYYYEVRKSVPKSPTERAARLIYLNRVCYNGLFRENSRGEFNVPMGRYKNPKINDEQNLVACSAALATVTLRARSFEQIVESARSGDLVYFDPPYHPLSKTSSFTTYSCNGFTEESQRLLAAVFSKLASRKVKVLLSNSETPLIRGLYGNYHQLAIPARRNVNSRSDRRGKINELLIRNF
jgi:DNA adenine methylase